MCLGLSEIERKLVAGWAPVKLKELPTELIIFGFIKVYSGADGDAAEES